MSLISHNLQSHSHLGAVLPTNGEIVVIGLGKSGLSSVRLLHKHGYKVYASDSSTSDTTRQSAEQLRSLGIDASIGGHDIDRILKAALVVVSPGVPPEALPVVAARAHGIAVISEIELALRCMTSVQYIAVTGTNGKTTTTALIGHILRALGHDTAEAGNIGTPLTDIALRDTLPDWIALELSSFQLHDTPSIKPTVGVLTNLAPDHLDRYPTIEAYYSDKACLFRNASPASRWVINADDPTSLELTNTIPGSRLYFSTASRVISYSSISDKNVSAFYDRTSNSLNVLGSPLLARRDLPLLGDHNVANTLAASLAVLVASPTHQSAEARLSIAAALKSFRPPPHRLELIGEWNGVQWINDSKATNVSSAYVAINGMTRPTILLLGGRHKGESYTTLATPIKTHVKRVIAYGESAQIIQDNLHDIVPVDHFGTDFEAVVAYARTIAVPGDTILLSPACSSYDMFKDYEERGTRFRQLARTSTSV